MYCKNCGHQINDNAKFCKNCGANITPKIDQMETAIVEQPTQVSNVPPPVYGNPVNVGTNDIPPSFKSSRDTLKRWLLAAGVLVVLIIIGVIATIFSSDETKFLSLSEQEQAILMEDLYERLDQHFVSDLQIDKQLAQLLMYEDEVMSSFQDENANNEIFENIGKEIGANIVEELIEILEMWATDNGIDFEDFMNSTSSDDGNIITDYLLHLMYFATVEVDMQKQEMRETIKQAFLTNEIFYYFDDYFIPVFQNNEQLMELLVSGDSNSEILKNNMLGEMKPIVENWTNERPDIRFEDWKPEDLVDEYIPHLAEAIAEKAKEVSDWIIGDWIADIDILNHESMITFGSDGSFELGGTDCFATGKFTIQGNTVHLNGTIECPDCKDCEESEYNDTITITGDTLEGYDKNQ